MKKAHRCTLSFLLAALLACALLPGYVLGAGKTTTRATTSKDINSQIDQTRQQLTNVKRQESSTLKKLTNAQKQLDATQANLSKLTSQLKDSQNRYTMTVGQLRQAEIEMANIQQRLSDQRDVLHGRLRALYLYGPGTYIEILMTARNFSDFVARFELVDFLIERDIDNIQKFEQTQTELSEKRIEIETRKREIQTEKERVALLHQKTTAQKQVVAGKVEQTRQTLNRIQQDRAELERALDELERTSREIEGELRKRGNGQQLGTGSMILPVTARISSPFGWRYHPILHQQKLHTGIDLAVGMGTPVKAADDGEVIFADWKGGYGKAVIIDHGAGITTLYAHNSVLLVRPGQRVVKGQIISKSGSTGYSTGPHLHFEVRKNGAPVDPLLYAH